MQTQTGYSSSRTSFSFAETVDSPIVEALGQSNINMLAKDHRLLSQLACLSSASVAAGPPEKGLDWIYATPWEMHGEEGQSRRQVHNAAAAFVRRPIGKIASRHHLLQFLTVEGDDPGGGFILRMPAPGLIVPPEARRFPPGALQIIIDDQGHQVVNEHTTLPEPVPFDGMPCSGWCKRRHLYRPGGIEEKAVIYYDKFGWPIACRETNLAKDGSVISQQWWGYRYTRPLP